MRTDTLGYRIWVRKCGLPSPHMQSCRLFRSGGVGSLVALQDLGSLPLTPSPPAVLQSPSPPPPVLLESFGITSGGTNVELPLQQQGGVQAQPSMYSGLSNHWDGTWQKQNPGPFWVISGGLSIGLGPHPRNRTELGLCQPFSGESQKPEVRDTVDQKPEGPSLEPGEDRTKPCG